GRGPRQQDAARAMTMTETIARGGEAGGDTLARFARAESQRRAWDALLDEAYRYALPNHATHAQQGRGERRDREVYDATAVNAVQWKKARLHGQLFPPFRAWMDFEAEPRALDSVLAGGLGGELGAALADPALARRWQLYLADARAKFHAAIEASNFHIEIDPALAEACISTGCILVQAGAPEAPLAFEAVPLAQLVPEEAADGTIRTLFRRRRVKPEEVALLWPDASLPAEIKSAASRGARELELIEALLHEPPHHNGADGSTRYELWLPAAASGGRLLLTRRYEVSPAIVFRMDKAPGEALGRGPVLNVLGDIKTANKVVELVLKNASIAVTGIWQAEDDGVLNPANVRLVPGAVIPKAVGSAGLTPLAPPGRFDVSQLVLAGLQESIRRGIMGPSLPPADERGRTAFEIDQRVAEREAVELPMSLRLLSELDRPLARRVLAILMAPAMAGSPDYIAPFEADGRRLAPRPSSPLIRLQDRAEAAAAQRAYLAAAAAFPDLVGAVVNRARYLRDFLARNGFPPEHLSAPGLDAAGLASSGLAEIVEQE
ncbi:MAG: portal protein, partial [Kiloniellales bacterium]